VTAVALSLLAACCWGFGDFRGGLLSRRIAAISVLLVVEAVAFAGSLLILAGSGAALPGAESLAWAAAAGAAGGFGLVTLFRAMAIGRISVVAPISACGAGLPVIVGLISGEHPGTAALAGVAMGLAGCTLASQEEGEDGEAESRAALVFAVLATLGVGLYLTGMHYATEDAAVWWPLAVSRFGSLTVGLLALRSRATLPQRGDLPPLAVVGCADLAGSLTYALATTQGLLTLSAMLASLYPVVSVLLARGTLGERLGHTQFAGVACALAGVLLMATY
jgi:drug/metabolite transporter (DMT)-like permease